MPRSINATNTSTPAAFLNSQPFSQHQESRPQQQSNPIRPVTPMTSEAAATLSMINSGGQGQNPADKSPANRAAVAPATSQSTPTDSQNQNTASRSPEDNSESDQEGEDDDGGRRRRGKKRPHKFYCTDFPPCKLSFTRSEHLSRHIRRHTGERPFTCHCNRSFTRLDNLRQHAQTVHANEPIPPNSLAAQGGRGQRQNSARKRPSISHGAPGVAAMPSGPPGHSRSLSTPVVNYGQQQYVNTFNTPPNTGPVNMPASAGGDPYQQHGPVPPAGIWGSQPQHMQHAQHPHPFAPGLPPNIHERTLGPPIAGPVVPSHGPIHGHNRSRSLMTPAEISRPAPPHLRDNFDRLRRPSYAQAPANAGQGPMPGHYTPPQAHRHRGHNRGQSHGAISLAQGPSQGFGTPPSRAPMPNTREWRLANQPQYNLQEEMARVRLNSVSGPSGNNGPSGSGSGNGSSGNTNGANGNSGTNSQSPVTPTDDYFHSPLNSPSYVAAHREFSRDRASVSSFDFAASLHHGGRHQQNGPGALPRPGYMPGMSSSLAAFTRNAGHLRSQSWNAAAPERPMTPIKLPELNYDEKEVRNRQGTTLGPIEPEIRM